MDLFEHQLNKKRAQEAPLADRLRPETLEDYLGQEQIVGEGRALRRAIEDDRTIREEERESAA